MKIFSQIEESLDNELMDAWHNYTSLKHKKFFLGDLWLSNILFRYATNPDTGETLPVEVKFIDFQAARFASLATDLVLFLFTSVQVSQHL